MTRSRQRVLVAYDASADADRGLDWAAGYAKARRLPIEVLSSSGDLEYLPERTSAAATELVERWLEQAAARLEAFGASGWTTTASDGKAVPELIEASRDAALMVLGARGHGILGGMVLGSVSQHVTRHAHCPVVVARAPHAPSTRRPGRRHAGGRPRAEPGSDARAVGHRRLAGRRRGDGCCGAAARRGGGRPPGGAPGPAGGAATDAGAAGARPDRRVGDRVPGRRGHPGARRLHGPAPRLGQLRGAPARPVPVAVLR